MPINTLRNASHASARLETEREMKTGEYVSVLVSHASNHTRGSMVLATQHLHGTVVKTTEKAVQLEAVTEKNKKVTAWFPRKALISKGAGRYHLASWFTAREWTARFLELTTTVSFLTA